jgi:N-acetylmuramoyl-L-alanine amidase
VKIVDHKLEGVPFEATPNMGGGIEPTLLVIHYTVVRTLKATVSAFRSPASNASAHVVIDVDGTLAQLVPFNRKAWHAGESEWAGRVGCNLFSIGIELVNPGPLVQKGGVFYDVNSVRWDHEVIEAKHKNGRAPWTHWAAYSATQLACLTEVGSLLVAAYQLADVVGHDDIAPFRKSDPGPAFAMDALRNALFGRAGEGGDEYVTTTVVNLRKAASIEASPAAGSPLPANTRLKLVDRVDPWWHVIGANAVEGWVHSRLLVRAPRIVGRSLP